VVYSYSSLITGLAVVHISIVAWSRPHGAQSKATQTQR
jgi:hypothetical protein